MEEDESSKKSKELKIETYKKRIDNFSNEVYTSFNNLEISESETESSDLEDNFDHINLLKSDVKEDILTFLDYYAKNCSALLKKNKLDEIVLIAASQLIHSPEVDIKKSAEWLVYRILQNKLDNYDIFLENNIMGYIANNFGTNASAKISMLLLKRSDHMRKLIVSNIYLEFVIGELNNNDSDISVITISEIMSGVCYKKYEQDYISFIVSNGLNVLIGNIYDILFSYFCNKELTIDEKSSILKAFFKYIDCCQLFMTNVLSQDIIPFFIENPIDEKDCLESVLLMCSTIARSSEQNSKYLIQNDVLSYLTLCLDYVSWRVNSLTVFVLSELLYHVPDLYEEYIQRNYHSTIIEYYEKNPTPEYILAASRFCIYITFYTNNDSFESLINSNIVSVFLDNIKRCEEIDDFFILYCIKKMYNCGFMLELPDHENIDDLIDFVDEMTESNDDDIKSIALEVKECINNQQKNMERAGDDKLSDLQL